MGAELAPGASVRRRSEYAEPAPEEADQTSDDSAATPRTRDPPPDSSGTTSADTGTTSSGSTGTDARV